MLDSAALSEFLSGVLSGALSGDEVEDGLADLGVCSVRSASEAGFYDPSESSFLVSGRGCSVLVSFQDRPY